MFKKVEEFKKTALSKIESDLSVDWSEVEFKHYSNLLVIATQNSLELTMEKISQAINQHG